jgi:hypothetical protein
MGSSQKAVLTPWSYILSKTSTEVHPAKSLFDEPSKALGCVYQPTSLFVQGVDGSDKIFSSPQILFLEKFRDENFCAAWHQRNTVKLYSHPTLSLELLIDRFSDTETWCHCGIF